MTVLLIFMIILLAVAVGMLLLKLILELWALCGTLSKRWEKLRKNYWIILSTTIVRIVLIVYGTWALYCMYQFKAGDSWAASLRRPRLVHIPNLLSRFQSQETRRRGGII